MHIKEKLIQLRKEAGLSQQEMAIRLGHSYGINAVSAIENGTRSIGLNTIEKWCQACGYSWEIIFHKEYKVYDLEDVMISEESQEAWMSSLKEAIPEIQGEYPDLEPEEIADEKFRVHRNGRAQIFIWVRSLTISMDLPAGSWAIQPGSKHIM